MPPRRVDVFFYGLFMDVDVLRARGIVPEGVTLASVGGFTLRIGKRATIVPAPASRVYGVVMSLSRDEVDRLYAEPSMHGYKQQAVLADLAGGGVSAALCYALAQPPAKSDEDPEYALQLRTLAHKIGLPTEYVASLM